MILQLLGFLKISFIDILDVIMVAAIIYAVYRWIKGSSAMNIFIAIIIILIVRIVASALNMKMMSTLLGTLLDVGAIALIIIFQPEIRRFLNNIGRSAGDTLEKKSFLARILPARKVSAASNKSIMEISEACMEMSETKTGALIVLRRNNALEDIIATGDTIDASIRCRLILNIFFKNSPLHDGALIVGDDRLIAARCTLPITESDIPAHYGMRHKAAVGISEQSDADVIVVSEQTGTVSFVHGGTITKVDSINSLKLLIGGGASDGGR